MLKTRLRLVRIRLSFQMPVQDPLRVEQVSGVNQSLPCAEIRFEFIQCISQHRGPSLVVDHFACCEIPVPGS